MAPVLRLGNIGRRLGEGIVGLFAILGFLYVPLGRHTGFEHAKAVLSTPAAAAALDDLWRTAVDLRQRAIDFVTRRAGAPSLPSPSEAANNQPPASPARAPRPVPPKLR